MTSGRIAIAIATARLPKRCANSMDAPWR